MALATNSHNFPGAKRSYTYRVTLSEQEKTTVQAVAEQLNLDPGAVLARSVEFYYRAKGALLTCGGLGVLRVQGTDGSPPVVIEID